MQFKKKTLNYFKKKHYLTRMKRLEWDQNILAVLFQPKFDGISGMI
jgi:hypothetical protein